VKTLIEKFKKTKQFLTSEHGLMMIIVSFNIIMIIAFTYFEK
jgi:hypothetical protein